MSNFDKGAKKIQWRKKNLFNKCWGNDHLYFKMTFKPYLSHL